jgi:hypothetical protein
VAALNVLVPGQAAKLIDVAFTSASATSETGYAATGLTANDFWNTCTAMPASSYQWSGALPNLKFVDGTASGAGLTIPYVEGAYGDAASDPMLASYLFAEDGNFTVTVTNLIAGAYDIYLYGHGNEDNQNSSFQVVVGSESYGPETTTNGPGWLSSVWQEGVQYVEFTNVNVPDGQTVTITVEPGGGRYAVLSGLQMRTFILPTNGGPLIITASNQFVNVNQGVVITNYAYSPNGPVSFTLASNSPAGAMISTCGVFCWSPICEQGSTTNVITVWATDSSTPPLSNSMAFSVIVGECVEISIGSSVQQIGNSTCVPVSLFSTISLTNLNFTLADPAGHFTNWSITPTNSLVNSATTQMVDPLHALFNFGVQNGQALQGSNGIGSICLDILPGPSAFVPLAPTDMGAAALDNSPITCFIGQNGRVVVIGSQSLLESWLDTNFHPMLTVYGNPGLSYEILTTTNLTNPNNWSVFGNVLLTNLFQFINLDSGTNPSQFFQAVQP